MIHLGLTGYPLGHSLSPRIHSAALHACGLEGDYSLYPVASQDQRGLEELLARVRSGEITGLSVTIPHKKNVPPLMDELSPAARAIGAVNTICCRAGRLVGENTDAAGFLEDLTRSIGDAARGAGRSALVLGAGGAARAVVYALTREEWQITVAARRIAQAEELARSFKGVRAAVLDAQVFRDSSLQLVVNATPVGMAPKADASPLPEDAALSPQAFVYDLVYSPRETRLVRQARLQGLQAETGLGMLVEQAALAFEIWTGQRPPLEVLFGAAEQ